MRIEMTTKTEFNIKLLHEDAKELLKFLDMIDKACLYIDIEKYNTVRILYNNLQFNLK